MLNYIGLEGISTESQKIKHRNRIHSGFSSDVQATLIEVLNPLAAQPSCIVCFFLKNSTRPLSTFYGFRHMIWVQLQIYQYQGMLEYFR
ncbi:hypothetical protein AV530_017481 [Patagioenas fasciata monilis]|uniref:Uncharacterized protein n=1 Tax=Patagioenas fasciata monilis TaxID=372326 RepID=A0A1V4JGC7_PATFA|nr:hypothetical protein AV530_017481 [Patagioenas fasciata monilis]